MGSDQTETWTPDKVQQMEALIQQNKSGSEIAAILGVTRNAVVGKAHRMGLSFKSTFDPNGRVHVMKGGRPRARYTRPTLAVIPEASHRFSYNDDHLPIPNAVMKFPDADPIVIDPPPSAGTKTLIELEHQDCRFSVSEPARNDFRFCGDRRFSADGKTFTHPYCPHHCRIAYQPRTTG